MYNKFVKKLHIKKKKLQFISIQLNTIKFKEQNNIIICHIFVTIFVNNQKVCKYNRKILQKVIIIHFYPSDSLIQFKQFNNPFVLFNNFVIK